MKLFDIEAAKAGAAVITKNGRKARIICFDRCGMGGAGSMVVLVTHKSQIEHVYDYSLDGSVSGCNEDMSLIMAPVKKEGWINLHRSRGGPVNVGFDVFPSESAAKELDLTDRNWEYVATIKIEWEE